MALETVRWSSMSESRSSRTPKGPHRVLRLDPSKLIASGKFRDVYVHPDDESKVVKVYREDGAPEKIRAERWYRRLMPGSRYDPNAIDLKEFRRIARTVPQFQTSVAPVFGYVETDRGTALVAGCVRNPDGSICESLQQFVSREGLAAIAPAIDELFDKLAQGHILVNDFNARNILVRQNGDKIELVIVDGFGDPAIIPRRLISRRHNRRKLMLKKGRLLRRLEKLAEG